MRFIVRCQHIVIRLLGALLALMLAALFPPPAGAQSTETDALYGAWMLLPGETLQIRLEAEAHVQYVASNCATYPSFRVNGGEMYGGVVFFPGVDLTVTNGTGRSCWVEVRGRMNRCVGSGCADNSQHWAVRGRGHLSGAGAVRLAAEMDNIFANNLVRYTLILIVGVLVGYQVVMMLRRIAGWEPEWGEFEGDYDDDDTD